MLGQAGPIRAAHQLDRRRGVVVLPQVHRVQERHLVDVLRQVREHLGDPRAGLAVLLPLERRLEALAAGGEEAGLGIGPGEFLAVALLQFRLVVPGIDLRRPAGHEQPDDRLRLRREMRLLRRQRIGRAPAA